MRKRFYTIGILFQIILIGTSLNNSINGQNKSFSVEYSKERTGSNELNFTLGKYKLQKVERNS